MERGREGGGKGAGRGEKGMRTVPGWNRAAK